MRRYIYMCKKTIFNLYIDESGNTGANMIDKDQNVFTYGAWLIQDSIENSAVNNILNQYSNLFNNCNNGELKSADYFKNINDYKEYYNLFNSMLKEKFVPFVLLLEKKFIITSYIVEVFFHFKDIKNDIELAELTNLKINISNLIYDNITDSNFDAFEKFWIQMYKNKHQSKEELDNIKQTILDIFNKLNLLDLSQYLDNSSYCNTCKVEAGYFIASLLARLLIHININNVEANDLDIKINVFHDQTSLFNELKKFIKKSNIENMLTKFNFPLNQINSIDNKVIQLSDLLAGFFHNVLIEKNNINDEAKNTIFSYFIDLQQRSNKGNVLFLSYNYEYKFISKLIPVNMNIIDTNDVINKFNKYKD